MLTSTHVHNITLGSQTLLADGEVLRGNVSVHEESADGSLSILLTSEVVGLSADFQSADVELVAEMSHLISNLIQPGRVHQENSRAALIFSINNPETAPALQYQYVASDPPLILNGRPVGVANIQSASKHVGFKSGEYMPVKCLQTRFC